MRVRTMLILLITLLLFVPGCTPQHDLTFEFDSSEGTALGEGKYQGGERVELKSVPEEGYQFKQWLIKGEVVSEEESFVYVMPGENVVIKANFEEVYILALEVDQSKGTVSGEGEYVEGEAVQLSATSLEEFDFVGWKLEDEIISREPDFVFTMSDEDVVVEADFALLSINHFDSSSGWVLHERNGETWFEDGKLFIRCTDENFVAAASYYSTFSDFILEVDVEWTDGSFEQSQHVAIRRNAETLETYRVTIVPTGFFSVTRQDEDGKLHESQGWTHSPYIKLDKNTIRVEAIGDNIRFFVNDRLLVEVDDATHFDHGSIAFFVGNATEAAEVSEAAFSNLVIRLP